MMKMVFWALAAWFAVSAAAAVHVSPTNEKIQYTGRVNFSNPERVRFVYPGVQIAANFEGTGLAMKAKPGSGYFVVAVDNLPVCKIYFSPTDSVITLASGLPTALPHTVRVYLCYEGYAKRPEFRGFILEGDTKLVAPPKRPKHRIEFVGNSITCGYGNESLNRQCGFADSTENHYLTYASLLCRMLDAEEHCTARSGIGVQLQRQARRRCRQYEQMVRLHLLRRRFATLGPQQVPPRSDLCEPRHQRLEHQESRHQPLQEGVSQIYPAFARGAATSQDCDAYWPDAVG